MKIAVFLAESPWGDIDEKAMGKGLGGRETALVHLATEWARAGHDVYAFVPREHYKEVRYGDATLKWIPMAQVIDVAPIIGLDMFISWENILVFKELGGADVGLRVIEMQVAHLYSDIPIGDHIDIVACLSQWAKDFFLTQHSDLPDDRVVVLPNGVDINRFAIDLPVHPSVEENEGYHFVYSSSPDRGLHHLLKMWQDIVAMVWDEYEGQSAYLHICYGAEKFIESSRWSHREDGLRALDIERLASQDGVIYHGKIGQDELAALMMSCDALVYPCDTMSPTETGCITIVEALAAGLAVATTDCDCLGDEFGEITEQAKLPLDYNEYIETLKEALHPEDYEARVEAGKEFAAGRDWAVIADQWIVELGAVKNPEGSHA